MWRSIRALRSFPRLKDIALILGKHGFHQVSTSLHAPVTARLRRAFKREPPHVIHQPERLRMALEELGPTFIKFGQLLSTRPDIIPPEYIRELQKLQDEVHPAPFDEVRTVIEEELGPDRMRHLREIHPTPLAAASIAQVHRATTMQGDLVVLKVQKRGLDRLVEQDLHVLRLLADFLSGWPEVRLFDPEGIVRAFERSIQRELNFDYERYNLLRIQENLDPNGNVRVPRVYAELSTSRVLTMEYLAGDKITSLRTRPLPVEQGNQIAGDIALCLLRQVFEHGLYHADPHPGNFILLPVGKIGLIDFGNVGRVTKEMTDDLFRLLLALLRRNYRDVARWVLKHGKPSRDTDADSLALEIMDSLDQYYGLRLEEIRIGSMLESLFSLVFRHGISVPPQFVLIGRTFVALEGVVRLCSPGLEVLKVVEPYLLELWKRRWSPESILRDVRGQAREFLGALTSYPTSLAEALSRLADGNLRIENKVPEIARLEKRVDQASERIQTSLLVCGLLVSSSILLFEQAGSGSLQTAFGVAGFLVGLCLVMKAVLRG
ncbi:MAG TPA: AarF/UbiB family protein [Planctomycetota bacterium]|nr:AarF/UbiB family protein [Planctomycetota bacterium]